jgi:hypothetical protein
MVGDFGHMPVHHFMNAAGERRRDRFDVDCWFCH